MDSTAYEKTIIRAALLVAQSDWLEEAEHETENGSMTGRTIAVVIADAFGREAEKYKTQPTKEMNDAGPLWIDDERGEAQGVPSSG